MKKVLLTLAIAVSALAASAQSAVRTSAYPAWDSTGYYASYSKTVESDGQCVTQFKGGTNNLGAFAGGNVKTFTFNAGADSNATSFKMVADSKLGAANVVSPYFVDMYYNDGTNCSALKATPAGLDLRDSVNGQKVQIKLSSDQVGDTVQFFIGSSTGGWPQSSTYTENLTENIIITSTEPTVYTINYAMYKKFQTWADRNFVNLFGFILKRTGQVVNVYEIKFGSEVPNGISDEEVAALGLSFFPNPAEDQVTVSYNANGKAVSVVLVDANGNAVASSVNDVINTSGLSSGLYYAKVLVDGEYATTSKIAVK